MSRKSREDKSSWKTTECCYAIVGDYGPYKFRGHKPVDDAVLLLVDLSSLSQQQQDANKNSGTNRSKKNGFNNSNNRNNDKAAKSAGAAAAR